MSGTLIKQPFAVSGDKSVVPESDALGFVNFQNGYTPDYEIDLTSGNPQAKAVERRAQNYLFGIITANQQAWQQLGFSEWYGEMPGGYNKNAIVMRYNGTEWRPYRSSIDANVNDPLSSPTWEYVPRASEALATIPMPSGGASGASALLVTAPTDFNDFATGTWNFQSDAVAGGSANAPAPPGGVTTAGMLESMRWLNAGNAYAVQRYVDRLGNSFFRGANNGSWGAWGSTNAAPTYSIDTSETANAVSATFPLASANIPDNSQFWVKIANRNTATLTFTPNPATVGARPVRGLGGMPMQGGEVVVNGRALFTYRADANDYILNYCSGGALQVARATASEQATNLGQVNEIVQDAASAALLFYMGQL